MARNTPHATSLRRCRPAIEPILPNEFFYDSEQAITLSDGEPEPDGAIVRGGIDDYLAAHSTPANVALVIEISNSTLDRDRGIKLRSYARAGIVCYWIINLIERQIEVYTQADSSVQIPALKSREIFKSGQSVQIILDGRAAAKVLVEHLLPALV